MADSPQTWRKRLTQGVVKDSVIYVVGELAGKALPFLLLPYLTRVLGAADFGRLAYYLAVGAFLLSFISLSQNAAITRYYYVYGKLGLGNVLLAGGLYSILMWAAATLVCAWLGDVWLVASCVMALTQSLLQNQLALRQCQKQPWQYVAIQLVTVVTNALLTVILLTGVESLIRQAGVGAGLDSVGLRLLAIILANGVGLVLGLGLARKRLVWRFSRRRLAVALRYVVALGLPLLLHSLSYTVKGQLDRVWVYRQYSPSELGIYAAGVQLASVVSIVILAINSATVPYLYDALKNHRVRLPQLHRWGLMSLLFAPMVGLMVWLLPSELFGWLLGARFAHSQYYAAMFAVAYALSVPYLLWVNVLFYHGKNRTIAACSLFSTGLYVLLLLASSRMGLSLVPWASILSNLAILPLLYHATRRL